MFITKVIYTNVISFGWGLGIEKRVASEFSFGIPTSDFYAVFWYPRKTRMTPCPFCFLVKLARINIWYVVYLIVVVPGGV